MLVSWLSGEDTAEGGWEGALDCRWPRRPGEDRFDLLDEATLGAHTGQCYTKAMEIMDGDDRLENIIAAASCPKQNLTVFCGHGRHMSLAAAEVIRVLTAATVKSEYPEHWCRRCSCLSCYHVVDCLLSGNVCAEFQHDTDFQ